MRCVSLCVYYTAVYCYCVLLCYIIKILLTSSHLVGITIYMLSREPAIVYTCTLVLQFAKYTDEAAAEGGGGPIVGVLGPPLSLPGALQAALSADGEVTPAPPTPAEQRRQDWASEPPPQRPQALPACVTVLSPAVLQNLQVVRGHKPLLLTVSAILSLATLVPTWGTEAPTLTVFPCVTGLQGTRRRAEGSAPGAPPPRDLGSGGHGSGAPQLDEEPAPDGALPGGYFSIYTLHFTLKL